MLQMLEKSNEPIFTKGLIPGWESDYFHVMKYQFVCYESFGDEVWEWCLDNLGVKLNWMVTTNGAIFRNEEDAVLFALRWC